MQEIKKIILSRIRDIIQLEQLEQKQTQKINQRYNAIMRQKQGEQQRNIKQNNILLSMGNSKFENQYLYSDILPTVLEICTAYDSSIKIQQDADQKIKLYKLLRNFFINNDFREKNSLLKSAFMRPYANVTEGIIFTWLSEWSKKKYLQILSLEIKNIKQKYIVNQNAFQELTIQKHGSIPNMTNSQGNRSSSSRKSDTLTQETINLSSAQSTYLPTIDRSQKFISASVGQINSSKILTIYNRHTLYGYIVDEMSEYYKLTGIGQLDKNYVKSIRKRKLKEYLILKQNLKRATQVIIEISANKQLRNLMKKYQSEYNLYKQDKNKQIYPQKLEKNSNRSLKKTQKIANDKIKTENVHSAQKRKQYIQKNQSRKQLNLELTRIRSSSLFEIEALSEQKINAMRIEIKKQLINKIQGSKSTQRKQLNFNMRLPSISKSFQKQHKSNQQIVERAKILRFPTQQQEQVQTNQNQTTNNLPKFKFNQRQTIKGIIIKNFLSNREKIYKNKQKIEEERKQQLEFLNGLNAQGSEKINSQVEQHGKKVFQCVDIRSLRQKTNAILRNLRTIQHY